MVFKQSIPEYLTNKKNTIIQIVFTAVFAYIFINIYRPFGYDSWYKVKEWEMQLASAVVVLTGMIVIILSRIALLNLKKTHEITYAVYTWFIVAEIFFMGLFFTIFELVVLHDERSPLSLLLNAVQNTSLILLIPYTLSILFFAWSDIKKRFENAAQQLRDPSEMFIPLKDEKGNLKVTIKCTDLLYLEANDNYVNIHYLDNGKQKMLMIRNTLKNYEKLLKSYPVYRVHRKFSVNIINVKLMIKGSKGFDLVMKNDKEDRISVSHSYEKKIIELMNLK